MISIQTSLTELERSTQQRDTVLDCYVTAIRNIGHYALELAEGVIAQYRQHLNSLAEEVQNGEKDAQASSRTTLRGLMRDFRDKS
jgi:hypothetical protein